MASLTKKTIVEIFAVLRTRYQSRFMSANRSLSGEKKAAAEKAAMIVWFDDLKALGVTDQTAKLGLGRSRTFRWPPSPAEFAEQCNPTREDLGIPGDHTAYLNMCQVTSEYGLLRSDLFLHPAIEATAQAIGDHVLRNAKDQQLRKLFNYEFSVAVSRCIRGDSPFKPSPHALPGHVEQDATTMDGHLDSMRNQPEEPTSTLET